MDSVREITCGTIAGAIGKWVDYPFDTIKTRLQDPNSTYKGTIDCISKTARLEGFWGFYGGIMSPMIGAAFENAAAFLMYGRASAFLLDSFYAAEHKNKGFEKPLWVVAAAGAFSGLGTGTVLTPVELIKARVQVNPKKYPSVPVAFKTTVSEEGPTAMFKGLQATLVREVPGNACWFLFYELTLRNVFIPTGKTRDDAPWYAFPISGGVGGIFYWSALFPADVVKTKMQVDDKFAKMGFIDTFKHISKTGGVKALYSGIGITLCRAPPANATIFGIYEMVDKKLKKLPIFQTEDTK